MPWVGMRFDQPLCDREVQLLLHTLSSDPHRCGDLRRSLRFPSHGDSAQHLPARTGQAQRLDQPVALLQELCIEPKNAEYDLRHHIDRFRDLRQGLSPLQEIVKIRKLATSLLLDNWLSSIFVLWLRNLKKIGPFNFKLADMGKLLTFMALP